MARQAESLDQWDEKKKFSSLRLIEVRVVGQRLCTLDVSLFICIMWYLLYI